MFGLLLVITCKTHFAKNVQIIIVAGLLSCRSAGVHGSKPTSTKIFSEQYQIHERLVVASNPVERKTQILQHG